MKPNVFLTTATLVLVSTACSGPAATPEQPTATQSPTPNLSPTPSQATAIARQFLAQRERFGACQEEFRPIDSQEAAIAYPIDADTYFVQVQCFLAAYQGNYEFFAYTPANQTAQRLTVTQYTQNEQGQWQKAEQTSVGGLPTYAPTTKTLTINSKYRGLGDCGAIGTYTVAAKTLKLTEFKAKPTCDGKMEPFLPVYPITVYPQ